jgi:raffinose/stachyose/melibiose transport system permease protein
MKSMTAENRTINIFRWALCLVVFLLIAVPLWISVMGGFKTVGQLRAEPASIPNPFIWQQYTDLLIGKIGSFWRELLNSVILGVGTVGIGLMTATFAGYALARIRFRFNNLIFTYFWLGLLFPLSVASLPLYLQLRNLGLLDTHIGVILPQTAFGLPMMVMLLRGFIRQIPNELEEAAAIDGYGRFGFLFKIVVPLSTPILATVSVLTFVSSWNNFFMPLLVLNKIASYPLPLGVMDFYGQHAADWNMILAFLTLAMVPAVIIYLFCQKYIVQGLTSGAVKG